MNIKNLIHVLQQYSSKYGVKNVRVASDEEWNTIGDVDYSIEESSNQLIIHPKDPIEVSSENLEKLRVQ